MRFNGVARLTKDPQTRAAGQVTVTEFSVAHNRKFKEKEETSFFDCECWSKQGEIIAEYLSKGRKIYIEGRLKQDTWETDGQRRSKVLLVVENFEFVDSNPETNNVKSSDTTKSKVVVEEDDDVPF